MKSTFLILSLSLAIGPALAIEKCRGADGKTLYTDAHCPPGTQRVSGLRADPPPSEADVAQAQDEQARLAHELQRIERAKAEREASAAKAQADAREAARQDAQQELLRRQTEALERMAQEQASTPAVVYLPVVPRRHLPPPRPQPPKKKADEDSDTRNYIAAPMPRRKSSSQ